MSFKAIILGVIFFIGGLFVSPKIQAQSQSLHMNLRIPYSYNIGYYSRFHDRLGFYLDVKLVTIPFHRSMIGAMKLFGADANMANILKTPFEGGFGFDTGGQFYYGKGHRLMYVTVGVNYMNLIETDITDEEANLAFNIDLSSNRIPSGAKPEVLSTEPLTLYSHFLQVNVGVGRRIPLFNKQKEVQIEFGIMKTVASHHRLYSDYRYLSPISDAANDDMQNMMKKYGIFPYFNVTYIFHFEKF